MSNTTVETEKGKKAKSSSKTKISGKRKKMAIRPSKGGRKKLKASLLPPDGVVDEPGREDLMLSKEFASASEMEAALKKIGIVGNEEDRQRIRMARCEKDPMYTFFFFADHPETRQEWDDGTEISLVDFLLRRSFDLLSETLGPMFTNFKLITETFQNLMETDDVHAKQWLFLFFLEHEGPIRDMVASLYSNSQGEEYTSMRLDSFLKKFGALAKETIALPYNDCLNDFNVKNMMEALLKRSVSDYMFYTKDPRFSHN